MDNKTQTRKSNMELLRIIAIILIIVSHYSIHGVIDVKNMFFSLNKNILDFMVLGNMGVIIFVMISGYFLCKKEFDFKKIYKLIFQVSFYSLIFYFVFLFTGLTNFNIARLIKSLFPIIYGEYWFISAYFTMYLLSPFINLLINKLSRKEYIRLLILLLLIWSIIPTLTTSQMCGYEVGQFIMFYLLGAYMRIYPNNIVNNNKNDI